MKRTKRFLFLLLVYLIIANNTNSLFAQYCIPTSTYGTQYNTLINSVELNNISNINTGSNIGPNYNDYTSQTAILYTESQNKLLITAGSYYLKMWYYAWIDYNHDNDFNDANELIGVSQPSGPDAKMTILFIVPSEALTGSTRLRVTCVWDVTDLDPCASYTYGETEDYTVITEGFYEQGDIYLADVKNSSVAWGDYDNNDSLDILLTGSVYGYPYDSEISIIYMNNGDNTFSSQNGISLTDVAFGSVSWGDYNTDGNLDFLLTGNNPIDGPISKIYKNNGDNSFTEQTQINLDGFTQSSTAWADFDNDGDVDCIISGKNSDYDVQTKIYWNENNEFIDANINLKGAQQVAIADYNNDNYPDIVMVGVDINGIKHTTLYKNNGDKSFSIQKDLPFINVSDGSVAWGDFDADGDLDILLSGQGAEDKVLKIYKNEGESSFNEMTSATFTGVYSSSIACGDYNNDGYLDFIVCGRYNASTMISKIYKNNGDETFTEQTSIDLTGVGEGSVAWGDYDFDKDLDLLLTGNNSGTKVSIVYKNESVRENTAPTIPSNLQYKTIGNQLQLSWDNSSDLETDNQSLSYNVRIGTALGTCDVISPMANMTNGVRKIPQIGNAYLNNSFILNNLDIGTYYWSVQAVDNGFLASDFADEQSFSILPLFTDQTGISLIELSGRSAAWGDYNNNGFLDILFSAYILKIYQNDQNGDFSDQSGITFSDISPSYASWGDYDNDGFLDIIITGTTGSNPDYITESKVFRNNGDNTFIEQSSILIGVTNSSLDWGDYDNDGDLDIVLNGDTDGDPFVSIPVTRLYKNDGNNTFIEQTDISLIALYNGSCEWGDYDNDKDLDLIITGFDSDYIPTTKIYRNEGNNILQEQSDILIEGVGSSSTAWGDYDNDGDLDLLLSGKNSNGDPVLSIYRNDDTTFNAIDTDIRKVFLSAVAWGDYNNDSYLDIIITGLSGDYLSKVYENNQDGTFSEISIQFQDISNGAVAWGDYDNNDGLDILLAGDRGGFDHSKVYKNNGNWPNNKPNAPTNLTYTTLSDTIIFSWDAATDTESTKGGLSYNMRLGATNNGFDIISPMSDTVTQSGFRRIPKIGNAQMNTGWKVNNLTPGVKYYWSVQAVDQSFKGGIWATEQSFTMPSIVSDFTSNEACFGSPTIFNDNSYTPDETITEWIWNFGDGGTSTEQNPQYTYGTYGTYDVTLTIRSVSYEHSKTKSVLVKPSPEAKFTFDTVCAGSSTFFVNKSQTTGVSVGNWNWSFGDGSPDFAGQNPPSHNYLAGAFNVKLKVDALNECSDSIENEVLVGNVPSVVLSTIGDSEFCDGGIYQLLAENQSNYTYDWREGNVPILDQITNQLDITSSGTYNVIITNRLGDCSSISSDYVVTVNPVPESPVLTAPENPAEFCAGDSLEISTEFIAGISYQWLKNNSPIAGETGNRIYASETGLYRLKVSNVNGCSDTSDHVQLIVNPRPEILTSLNIDGETEFCSSDSVILSTSYNENYIYNWYRNNLVIPENEFELSAKESGTYKVEVAFGNCSVTTISVIVKSKPVPGVPYINYTGGTEFCEGNNLELLTDAITGVSYEWLWNGAKIGTNSTYLADQTGEFLLKEYITSDCPVYSSNSVNLTVNETPEKPILSLSGAPDFCDNESIILSAEEQTGVSYQWYNSESQIFDATNYEYETNSTGNFYVKVTNTSNCVNTSNTTNVVVTEIPSKPVVDIAGYNTSDCPQEKIITLSFDQATNLFTYQWQRNGVSMDGETESELTGYREEGDYTVVAINGICENESDPESIYYDPELPDKPEIIATGPNVWYLACTNDKAEQYEWYYSNEIITGANEYLYVANQNLGIYNVRLAEENGCFVTSDAVTIPLVATGINNADPFVNLKIYPNPTPGVFTIEMDNQIYGELITRIFSQNAVEILNIKFDKSTKHFKAQVDLSGQGKGMYIISFVLDKCKAERKLVVE